MLGCKIIQDKGDGYLCTQRAKHWMKFVDDLDRWYAPANKVVQVSSSHVRRKDFGVNRERVET